MNNCFLKKYKRTVNDGSFTTLGAIRVKVHTLVTQDNYILIGNSAPISIKVVSGNGHIGTSRNDISYTELNLNTGEWNGIFVEKTDFEFEILPKYCIYKFGGLDTGNLNYGFCIDDLKYNTLLYQLILSGGYIDGDLSSIANVSALKLIGTQIHGSIDCFEDKELGGLNSVLTIALNSSIYGNLASLNSISETVQKLNVESTQISGILSDFHPKSGLNELNIQSTRVSGTVESFAASVAAVRNSGTLILKAGNSLVKYQGLPVVSNLTITFTGDGNYTIS